ncbi:hypothetical protein WISP_102595 [Willisornis vidua]|uniref:Uncharacterized protein n=1 Tax=Willisornis vidua TaxID=1566151 RepID=A0ABQ9CY66_9PASS|nr:hypothetical protein WISP_102595 [Willisornis vidua]
MLEGRVSTGWAGRDGTGLEEDDEQSFFKNWVWFILSNINSAKSGEAVTKFAKYTILSMEETVTQEEVVMRTGGIPTESHNTFCPGEVTWEDPALDQEKTRRGPAQLPLPAVRARQKQKAEKRRVSAAQTFSSLKQGQCRL